MEKKQIKYSLELIVKFFFAAFILYVLWGIYFANLGYDVEKNHTIQAGLYAGEEKLEDVTIEVEGVFRSNFFQPDHYAGRFAVSCFPQTLEDRACAHIGWQKERLGGTTWEYQIIRFYRLRPDYSLDITGWIDTDGNSIISLNKDMTEIVWETADGKYIATSEAYQNWLAERKS